MSLNFMDIAKTIVNMPGGSKEATKNLEDLAKSFDEFKKTASVAQDEKQEENPESIIVNGHNYSVKKEEKSVLVSFTTFPSNSREFKQVYQDLLGKNEYTVPALIPMALEIFARNQQEGEKCIETFCSFTAKSEMIHILKDKFGHPNDPYCQRYLPAALLQGASNKNAYVPNRPYTVRIEHATTEDEESEMYNGKFYYLMIITEGWDSQQRGVQVLKQNDKELFFVNGCPATYTNCKPFHGTWAGLE